MAVQGFRASSAKHLWRPGMSTELDALLDSSAQCLILHQFVTAKAFYPLLLAVCHPVSSAYIITLDKGVGHSWDLLAQVWLYAKELYSFKIIPSFRSVDSFHINVILGCYIFNSHFTVNIALNHNVFCYN